MEAREMIAIRGLTKTFGTGSDAVTALRDIDLSVRAGEIFGIIGLSGAGKSTLVRCMNYLEHPTEGSVTVDGKKLGALNKKELLNARRGIGMIFQQFNLLMQRTCLQNICFPMELAGVKKEEAEKRAKELLEMVGLPDKANAYPAQLSGGQKQRIAIARALASDPKVLLCDEATSALDPMTTQSILSLLQKINRELGITVVLITHEMAVIRQICNKVAILDGGKLAEQGTVDDVFMHTKSAAGRRLFGILPEQEEIPPQPAIRIVFDGEAAEKPIISKLVKDCGLDVNILSADIRQLNQKAYGQMLIARPQDPEDVKRVMEYLALEGLTVEEVHVP